jgi:hypothetical protein
MLASVLMTMGYAAQPVGGVIIPTLSLTAGDIFVIQGEATDFITFVEPASG